jgi:hypothetical protein
MALAMLTDRLRPHLGREFGAYITNPIFLSHRLDYPVKNKPNLLFQKRFLASSFSLTRPAVAIRVKSIQSHAIEWPVNRRASRLPTRSVSPNAADDLILRGSNSIDLNPSCGSS